jgi:uncharacterized protein (TIGR03083 family)
VVSAGPELTTDEVASLLAAYALDACTPEETAAIDAVLARDPDLAAEAARLVRTASWIGAAESLRPPASLRDRVRDAVRAARPAAPAGDAALDTYLGLSDALAGVLRRLPDDVLDETTANGLSAHDLVVHMAAQESLLAQEAGVSPCPDVDEADIDARTAALVPRFADGSVADAADLWRRSVDANAAWARANAGGHVNWRGLDMSRDDAIVVRAFETWLHTDDLRRAAGWAPEPPSTGELTMMSELASRMLPLALMLTDRAQPGRTARLVLTGAGGGSWLVPMGDAAPGREPDVTLTADVVDWCLLVGDRLAPGELRYTVDGDASLADALVAAAPALATL